MNGHTYIHTLTRDTRHADGDTFLFFQAPKRERKKSRKKETDIVGFKLCCVFWNHALRMIAVTGLN